MIVDVISICILLLLSGFFSGSESALFSLRWWRLHSLAHKGGAVGKLLAEQMERPRQILITILLGNTLVNVAASSMTEHLLEEKLPEQGLWVAIAVMTIVLLVAGEITPKTLAVQWPEKISLISVRPIYWFSLLITPLRILLVKITDLVTGGSDVDGAGAQRDDSDFLHLVEESHREGILSERESLVVQRIMTMSEMSVVSIMVPRTEMTILPDSISSQEAITEFKKLDLRRIPLYRNTPDRITGVLYAKDLLTAQLRPGLSGTPAAMSRPPYFVPDCINLKQLYAELSVKQIHIAIVLDEYGGTAGMVTMEDILFAIFENAGEGISHEMFCKVSDGSIIIDPRIELIDLGSLLKISLPDLSHRTLNGLITNMVGRIPRVGEIFKLPMGRIEIISATNSRITKVRITRIPKRGGS